MTVMYLVMHLQGRNTLARVPLNSRICNLRNDIAYRCGMTYSKAVETTKGLMRLFTLIIHIVL